MRLYLELAKKATQRQLAYRQANLAGLATNLFFGALRAYVLIALYGLRPEIAGYTLTAAITYTGLTQAILRAVQIFGWQDLMKPCAAATSPLTWPSPSTITPSGWPKTWVRMSSI